MAKMNTTHREQSEPSSQTKPTLLSHPFTSDEFPHHKEYSPGTAETRMSDQCASPYHQEQQIREDMHEL